jgi:hypothetical protein
MNQELRDEIAQYNSEAIVFEDLDDAIIGIGQQHGGKTVVIYDRDKCIEIFAEQFFTNGDTQDAWTHAIEWYEHNVENAYVGENTPIFISRIGEN